MHIVDFYYKNISRCTVLWMSNAACSWCHTCNVSHSFYIKLLSSDTSYIFWTIYFHHRFHG